MTTAKMLVELVGSRTLLVAHAPGPIPDSEWDRFLGRASDVLDAHGSVNFLVRTDGAGPNGLQRGRLEALVAKGTLRIAVLTKSRIARGIVTAISWTQRIDIKAFDPAADQAVAHHLGLSQGEREQFMAALLRLEAEVANAAVADG